LSSKDGQAAIELMIEVMSIFERRGISEENAIETLWGLLTGIYANLIAKGMSINDVENDIEKYRSLMSKNVADFYNSHESL
jgi:hypothetical protein